jgi:transposase
VRDWAKGLGQRAKTDKQDALLLARFAAERPTQAWQPLPHEVSELECLLERQRDLEQLLGQERNRWESLQNRPGIAKSVVNNVEHIIRTLEEALAQIQQEIESHLKQYTHLHADANDCERFQALEPKMCCQSWYCCTVGTA